MELRVPNLLRNHRIESSTVRKNFGVEELDRVSLGVEDEAGKAGDVDLFELFVRVNSTGVALNLIPSVNVHIEGIGEV